MAGLPNNLGAPQSLQYPQHGGEVPIGNDDDDGQVGDWSGGDDSGNDDRKRKRPMSVSCELCKQRKVKCDRGQPACGWCARNGHICEYRERKKPGLRAGYGRELEARLDRLEAMIHSQQTIIAQLTGNVPPAPPTPSQQQHAAPEANMFATPQGMQAAAEGAVRAESSGMLQSTSPYAAAASSSSSAAAVNSADYRGSYQGYGNGYAAQSPYAKQEAPLLSPNGQPYYTSNGSIESSALNQAQRTGQPETQDHDFPPYDLLYGLCDLYFKHVNTWCPILHRRTTLDTLFGTSSLDEADRIMLHAIVATTLRFSTDPRLTPDKKEMHHNISKQKVLLYGLENSSVKALQALVILALDFVGISNGPPGWNVLALITRAAVQLGLSVEPTSQIVAPSYPSIYTLRAMTLSEPTSWIEDESRRRLFWMVYILDRYATITTAFDFALDEKEIDRKLPCRDDMFSRNAPVETRWFRHDESDERQLDKPENLGSFSYYVEVVGILSRIHQFLKKAIDITSVEDVERWQGEYRHLDTVLTAWKNALPKEYGNMTRLVDNQNNKIVNCGWVMLYATFHTTTIRLHSSAAYPTTTSPIFTPSYSAGQRCMMAVEQISALCVHVKNNAILNKLGPPFAFSVWVAARLLLVNSSVREHQINPQIHTFLSTLRELGEHWAVADRYGSLLQRVLDEFAESERAPMTGPNGERITPSSVKILADMRRCAFDLDFLISRAPRSMAPAPPRMPAANELEYLDVFDFFNMPRLPTTQVEGAAAQATGGQPYANSEEGGGQIEGFNITNFTVDANSDFLTR